MSNFISDSLYVITFKVFSVIISIIYIIIFTDIIPTCLPLTSLVPYSYNKKLHARLAFQAPVKMTGQMEVPGRRRDYLGEALSEPL